MYHILYNELPRISDKKTSPKISSVLRDVRIAYLTTFSMSFRGRTSGGTIAFRVPIGPSAAAPMGPISYLSTVIQKPKTLDGGRREHIGERQQDAVYYLEVCKLHRSMVSFIVRCSNNNVPRVAGAIRSANGSITSLTIGIAFLLHRAGRSGLFIDRPGDGARSHGNLSIFPVAALVLNRAV